MNTISRLGRQERSSNCCGSEAFWSTIIGITGLFLSLKKMINVPQGAAPGRPDPGAAGCTGRIVGANNGGERAKNNGSQNNSSTRVNPQLEAVRTYGPGR